MVGPVGSLLVAIVVVVMQPAYIMNSVAGMSIADQLCGWGRRFRYGNWLGRRVPARSKVWEESRLEVLAEYATNMVLDIAFIHSERSKAVSAYITYCLSGVSMAKPLSEGQLKSDRG